MMKIMIIITAIIPINIINSIIIIIRGVQVPALAIIINEMDPIFSTLVVSAV